MWILSPMLCLRWVRHLQVCVIGFDGLRYVDNDDE